MKKREFFNYENPKFFALRDPMREVIRAYWAAMQYYASIKEIVRGRYGMAYLSDSLHTMEHKQPEYIDQFSAIMRQQGLEIEYPSVPELDELLDSLDEVFRVCIELNDNVDKALQRFINCWKAGLCGITARVCPASTSGLKASTTYRTTERRTMFNANQDQARRPIRRPGFPPSASTGQRPELGRADRNYALRPQ